MCGIMFYGRADARYCTKACRQRAYRERTARRAALETVPRPRLGDAAAQSRRIRQQARAARENSSTTLEHARALRENSEVVQQTAIQTRGHK
jgi:hypothetical protein